MAPVPLHQVYSRALFGEGHGYPVWDGELEENEDGTREYEIEVGTVVRYDDGKFWILFHSMRDADDPEQKHGTPPTFVRFTPPPSATSNWRSIKHSLVTSAHVSDHSVDLRASASPVGLEQLCSLDAGITFSHKAKSGGVLCFQTPVQARKLPSKLFIVRHMSEHFDSWVEFANERVGIGLRTQEIFFVHGTQKTCRWACGAFEAHARNVEGSLGASFTPAGSVELKVKFGSHDAARQHFNFGPSKDPRAPVSETAAPMDPATAPFNQCIFLNYYKAKRRLQLWRPRFMEAGAGPHELPDDGDSDDSTQYAVLSGGRSGESASSNSSDFGEVPERGMPYDPVELLLDYILENSEASIAIACDTDLYALFHDSEFPGDAALAAAIHERKPPIEVDERGAGTVAVDHSLFWHSRMFWDKATEDATTASVASYLNIEFMLSPGPMFPEASIMNMLSEAPEKKRLEEQAAHSQEPLGPEVTATVSPEPHTSSPELEALDVQAAYTPSPKDEQELDNPVRAEVASTPSSPRASRPVVGDPSTAYAASIPLPEDEDEIPPDTPADYEWPPWPSSRAGSPDTVSDDVSISFAAAIPLPSDDDDEPPQKKEELEEETRVVPPEKTDMLAVREASLGHTRPVTSLAYSHDSKWLATGGDDSYILLWDTATQTIVRRWEAHTDAVWVVVFAPDDTCVASASGDGDVIIWSVTADTPLATLSGHTNMLHTLAWSPDGKWLASGSDDCTARIWDAETYEELYVLEGHETMITSVKFSRDSRWLYTAGADNRARLWNVEEGTIHAVLRGHQGTVWTADFDADSLRIVTCSDDLTAKVWSVRTGEMLLSLAPHKGPVWNVWFTKDGSRILTVSGDSTMRIYDSHTGERKLTMEGHTGILNAGVFSPDEKYIASASNDDTVRLWRAEDGVCLATFTEHDDKVTVLAFSPDGRTLASAADDGTVRIRLPNEWDPDHLEAEKRRLKGKAKANVRDGV